MQHLCSRAGTLAMTAGGLVLLSLPVVALAKGPPDVVGGGTDTARSVVSPQAKVPDPPPGQLHNSPQASKPAPRPHPKAQTQTSAPTAPATQAPAARPPSPGRGPAGSGPARRGPKTGHPGRGPKAKKAAAPPTAGAPSPEPEQSAPGGGTGGGGDEGGGNEERSHSRSRDKPNVTGDHDLPRAGTGDTAGEDISGAITGDTVELPDDASPETLPFTGLQLLLITMTGLAAIGGGAALRRRVQRGRP
jgi:hypothetical protein